MFADDNKIIGTIRPNLIDTDRAIVQRDIDSISIWCKEWRMQLNADKFKVMHIRKKVTSHPYSIQNSASRSQALEITTPEKDLGIMISNDLKPRSQVQKASSKVNMMLAVLKSTFVYRDPSLCNKLYTSYVRPHLEYAISAWSPYTKADKLTLEKVERRATLVTPRL